VALALAVGLALISWLMPGKSAGPAPRASNPRVPAAKKAVDTVQPSDLDVRLEDLKSAKPPSEAGDRNQFRFYVPPPPAPPAAPPPMASRDNAPLPPVADPGIPPPPPRIPLKFIGIIEVPGGGKVAALSDCRATMHGREGEIIAGQYRLVHIGVESIVMEYVDGRGRETIRMSGQECVGK
jgi:hypothetical protein